MSSPSIIYRMVRGASQTALQDEMNYAAKQGFRFVCQLYGYPSPTVLMAKPEEPTWPQNVPA